MQKKDTSIVIKRNLKAGDLDAETDADLLSSCFIDKGDLEQLMDVQNPAAIVLGRTGSGKSALLLQIKERAARAVRLDPHDISIRFLEHSDIIQFFDALGVNLDLFYRLLWRHILTVELLKLRYSLADEGGKSGLMDRLWRLVERDRGKKQALSYFSEWGDRFWLDTDKHLREITEKFSRNVRASVQSTYGDVELSAEGARGLSQEQVTEITQRAKQVVSDIQIKKLVQVLDLLADSVFDDPQKKFYILIDKLDEDWASTETRCRFIRALIEEVKTFRRLTSVKIIVALRQDLLDLVFDRTRDAGFQEEKYESYLLRLRWSPADLRRLIEKRINEVFRRQYTSANVRFDDVFPPSRRGGGKAAMDFMLERALLRPRDLLQFANETFVAAYGKSKVTWRMLVAAEAQYSLKRLKSLQEEWFEIYPDLGEIVEILRGLPVTFTKRDLDEGRLEESFLRLYDSHSNDICVETVKKYFDSGGKSATEADVVNEFIRCLYRVGAVGVKTSSLETFVWSYIDHPTLSRGEAKRANLLKVHKMLHRSLDVRTSDARRRQ